MFLNIKSNKSTEAVVVSDLLDDLKECKKMYQQDRLSQSYNSLLRIDKEVESLSGEMKAAVLSKMSTSKTISQLRKEGGILLTEIYLSK